MKYMLSRICCIVVVLLLCMNPIYAQETATNPQGTQSEGAQTPENQANQDAPVVGENVDKAIKLLTALELVKGKEDGQFHPEQNITREEFTKVVVEFLGFSKEIELLNKDSKFKDIEAGRWSSGYINMALNLGIIKGYDNDLFKPTEQINMGQGITILLRGMGYSDAYLKGEWPVNYILKASQENILNGINNNPTYILTRGDVALMLQNALDANYIEGIEGSKKVSDENILEGKLKIFKIKNVRIIHKEFSDDKYSIKVEFTKDANYKENSYEEGSQVDFDMKNNVEIDLYEGMDYTMLLNDSDKVVYFYQNNKNNDVLTMKTIVNDYDERPEGKIKLSSDDEFITVDNESEIYVNGEKIKKDKYRDFLNKKIIGDFIVKEEKLIYANLILWEDSNVLVKSIDAQNQIIKGIFTNDGFEDEIDFKLFKDKYKVYLLEGNNAKRISFNEIIVNQMISISDEIGDNKERIIYVWKNDTLGKIQKVFGTENSKDIYFMIEGNQERFYIADEFSYRYNANTDIEIVSNDRIEAMATLEDFYNEQVTSYKNLNSEIVYIEGNFNTQSNLYGILLKYGDEIRGEIQILTKSGSKTLYAFEDPDEYVRLKEYASVGNIIKYSINKSGKLKDLNDNVKDHIVNQEATSEIKNGNDFGIDYVEIKGKKYFTNADTAYFDYTQNDPANVKSMTWSRFKDRKVIGDVKIIYVAEDDKLKLLIIRENLEGITEEDLLGYVKGSYKLGNKYYVSVENEDGVISEYQLDDTCKDMFLDKRIIIYKITTDNKLKLVENEDVQFATGEIQKIKGRTIDLNNEEYIFSKEDTLTDGNEKIKYSELKSGDFVALYTDNGIIRMGRMYDFGKYSRKGEGVIKNIDVDDETVSIQVGNKEKTFYCTGDTEYITSNGYLQIDGKSTLLIEKLNEVITDGKTKVKFLYNKETEEIDLLAIED